MGKFLKKGRAAMIIFLVLLLSCALILPVIAYNADYTRPGSTSNSTIFGGEFLKEALDIEMCQEETKYLELYADFGITYGSHIPSSYVSTVYDENSGRLEVYAAEYAYNTASGVFVAWRPVCAVIDGVSHPFEKTGEEYELVIDGVIKDDENKISVIYTTEFTVSADVVNEFINKGYNDAVYYKELIEIKKTEYETALEQYYQDIEKYEQYLIALTEYKALLKVYEEYLVEKRIYDEELKAYNDYLLSYEDYLNKKDLYENYLAALEQYNKDYNEYLLNEAYLETIAEKIKAYEEYLAKLEIVREQLSIIESTKTPVTHLKRTIYGAIVGDTVTSVIENKDAIANEVVGASAEAVDKAGIATENIRELFKDYFALSSEQEKYNYYITNYDAFKDNFAELFKTLDCLYLNKRVRGILISQELQEKYIILLAQLYYISMALNDGNIQKFDSAEYYDGNYIIGHIYPDKISPRAVITDTSYMPDTNNAAPLADGYPATVERPDYQEIPEPQKPEYVPMPIEPERVEEPTPPPVVEEPVAPPVVEDPGDVPEPYSPPTGVLELIDAFDSGEIPLRDEVESDLSVSPKITVNKVFFGAKSHTVVYHDHNGNILYETMVESGSFAEYGGEMPHKEEDSSAVYTFVGWMDSDGNAVDLSSVNEDLLLYPIFRPDYKYYNIVFIVDGVRHEESVMWGEVPKYDGLPQKDDEGNFYYVFVGWDKEITAVDGDAVYNSVFEKKYILPYADSGAEIKIEGDSYVADCHTSPVSEYDISQLLVRAYQKYGIILRTSQGDISFSFSETINLYDRGGKYLSLSVIQKGKMGYSYKLTLKDEGGAEIDNIKAAVALPCSVQNEQYFSLYYLDSEKRVYVENKINGNLISFNMYSGRNYYAVTEYGITLINPGVISFETNKSIAYEGDLIEISYQDKTGVEIKGFYYIDSHGTRVDIEGNMFRMPADSVSVGVVYKEILYTIKFESDGKIISTLICKYGDIVTPPSDPKKASNSKYSYTFIGWSREILPVTEDYTYVALYSAQKIPPKLDTGGIQLSDRVLLLFVLGGTFAGLTVFAVIPSSVMTVVLIHRQKKQFLRKKRD